MVWPVEDNGTGIDYANLKQKFGKNGVGRLTFLLLLKKLFGIQYVRKMKEIIVDATQHIINSSSLSAL